jgi:hypothetical protein
MSGKSNADGTDQCTHFLKLLVMLIKWKKLFYKDIEDNGKHSPYSRSTETSRYTIHFWIISYMSNIPFWSCLACIYMAYSERIQIKLDLIYKLYAWRDCIIVISRHSYINYKIRFYFYSFISFSLVRHFFKQFCLLKILPNEAKISWK